MRFSQAPCYDSSKMLFIICAMVLITAASGLWAWMLAEAILKEPGPAGQKLTWIGIILLTYVFGAAVYFFIRRPKRMAECSVGVPSLAALAQPDGATGFGVPAE
ncbi:MAG: PLDc N-terminal domain-containing protein [Bryobacteraceae bacterium]